MENQYYIEASVNAIHLRNFDHIGSHRNGLDLIVSCFYSFSFGISENDASLLFVFFLNLETMSFAVN